MPAIISLLYLVFGFFVFTRKVRISTLLSGFLLFLSLSIFEHKPLLIFIYSFLIIIVTIVIYRVKASIDKKEVFYFSIPCWLLIISVIINLINN
ncbi:hypothetical protein DNK65_21320 [Citrobacter koseri]|nr:hypothetical protein [Citrobacter koseri]MBE0080237.1 hypothetical protein [Citrobacter koseri]OHY39724.1 hypothetical protein BBP07_21375 [Citrobacter koseri]PYZ80606.1 hypothetical protein DNK65_21320 [Citrobacter koseri]